METDLRRLLFILALQNAVKYDGLPKKGTVIGMLMGKHPEFRSRAKDVATLAGEVLAEVEALNPDERRARLEDLAPELAETPTQTRARVRELPALENAEKGVVMRFAPNPSGPLHLGHARAAVLNDIYVNRYGGEYILRIEDTDPKRVDPEAYVMVSEDIAWLGLNITDTVYQSDRLHIYYDYGKQLIERGGAYVCTCEPEYFRTLKQAKRPCPCRDREIEENLELWEKMHEGEFYDGEASVRVKTDLEHPDPAMRDFPAFRILTTVPHPRIEARVYPLMNFSVAVDDHLLGMTHVIRGKDHIANTRRQRYIFDYFNWDIPIYYHYGRMAIEDVVLSTSRMREGISSGEYTGWDDIRLGTLRALDRRGIQAEAVRETMLDIGIGDTDISFSWKNLFARNKQVIDPVASRYFFVPDPEMVQIHDAPPQVSRPMLHPGDSSRGRRTLRFEGLVFISMQELKPNRRMMRLKDLFNVRIDRAPDETYRIEYLGDSLDEIRAFRAPIIQWLPVADALSCTLKTPEGDLKGVCEPGVKEELGNVVQFERIGFARIDEVTPEGLVAYFSHR